MVNLRPPRFHVQKSKVHARWNLSDPVHAWCISLVEIELSGVTDGAGQDATLPHHKSACLCFMLISKTGGIIQKLGFDIFPLALRIARLKKRAASMRRLFTVWEYAHTCKFRAVETNVNHSFLLLACTLGSLFFASFLQLGFPYAAMAFFSALYRHILFKIPNIASCTGIMMLLILL